MTTYPVTERERARWGDGAVRLKPWGATMSPQCRNPRVERGAFMHRHHECKAAACADSCHIIHKAFLKYLEAKQETASAKQGVA